MRQPGFLIAAVAALGSGMLASGCARSSTAILMSYRPVSHATAAQLDIDATVLQARMHAFGVRGASASVSAGAVVLRVPGSSFPAIPAMLLSPGLVTIRAVRCLAAAYEPPAPGASAPGGPMPRCAAAYRQSARNDKVTPNSSTPNGYTIATIGPDPAFAPYPSTTPAQDSRMAADDVLLPGAAGSGCSPRCVLGPAALTLGPVAAASTGPNTGPQAGVVDITFSAQQAKAWNALSRRQFHAKVGIDVDGSVLSAPLTEPTQQAFVPFGTSVQIGGDLSRSATRALTADLDSGPMPDTLRP